MPKAQTSFEEDEKTTIESGWEEEASTTVEQGDVADKIRQLGVDPRQPGRGTNGTNITNTSSNGFDEPTVDDQRANAALSMLTSANAARLVITQGNDGGQEYEIRPGKDYTIGRGLDNDVVLTDIAVSRKHFDLRHENGAWVLADRGSGNGTVVNGNLEDHPFMLANGDVIEIGNTSFRFDHQGSLPRPAPAPQSFHVDVDEEEPSTVAGKPLREELPMPPMSPPMMAPPPMAMERPIDRRPKTAPPPAPRLRSPSAMPPVYPMAAQGSAPLSALQQLQMAQPASTLPMPPMHHRGPVLPPQAPTMLGTDPMQMRPQMHPHDGIVPLANVMPSTIPGQGPPMSPSQQQLQALHYGGYPMANGPLHINGAPGRDPTATAHVPPTPFNMMPMPMASYVAQPSQGQLSRRTKLLLGGAALTLLGAIATIAILKNTTTSTTTTPAKAAAPVKKTEAKIESPTPPTTATTTKPSDPPKLAATEPPKTPPPVTPPATPPVTSPTTAPTPPATTKPVDPPKIVTTPTPPITPPPPTTKPPEPPPPVAVVETPKSPPKVTPPPPKPPRGATRRPPKATPKPPPRVAVAPDPPDPPPAPRNVGGDPRKKADELYRAKRFAEAGALLKKAATQSTGPEASQLRSDGETYIQLGQSYYRGMAPATKAADAYAALDRAKRFDNSVGRMFVEEVDAKLATVAPKAAIEFLAKGLNKDAYSAMRTAESLSAPNDNTRLVRKELERRAGELYTAAKKELDSNPDAAKSKLNQIKSFVESKNQWWQKANELLGKG